MKRQKAHDDPVASERASPFTKAHDTQPGSPAGSQPRLVTSPPSPLPNPHFNAALQQCVYPHILSFNTFADCYIDEMVKELPFVYVDPFFDAERHEANPYYRPSNCELLLTEMLHLAQMVDASSGRGFTHGI